MLSFLRVGLKNKIMQELWIKKTIYRRYLIEDDEIENALMVISENTQDSVDLMVDIFDKNNEQEYDEEYAVLPIEYSTRAVENEA